MSNYNFINIFCGSVEFWLRGGIAVKRRTTPRFWLLMIFTTIVVFSVSLGVLQYRYSQGRRQLYTIREYRDDLILQVRDLTDALAYAQTDDYIIQAARDHLGMIMPGEVRYVNGSN